MKKNISEKELQEAFKITIIAHSQYSRKELEANFNRAFDELSYNEQKTFENSIVERNSPTANDYKTTKFFQNVMFVLIIIMTIVQVKIFFDTFFK